MATQAVRRPGIARTLARYRAQRTFDVRYRLDCRLTVNTLHGRQQIRFRLRQSLDRGTLALDWRPQLAPIDVARTVRTVMINGARDRATAHRYGHLEIPARSLARGENLIELEWQAPIRASGSAVTRYRDPVDGALYMHSLFVPADASSVFPCFDQPDLKARFTLLLSIPEQWTAIANAPAISTERAGRARRIHFAETEPISTYTFAFAAGPFVAVGSGKDSTRLWVRRSQRRSAQRHAGEILRLNREAVRYCTNYFDHPFPFRKYDLVLIPQFPYRGMEHAGATFLDEAAVLLSKSAGQAARFQRAQLIFHETAHQWMGDLVTMRWFDDLWIKEGYANFIAYKLAEQVCSREYARLAFHDLKMNACEVDALPGTTALHHPLADLTQAKSVYSTLVYAKAPAVLRMLERLLGEQAFRRGMRALVRSHAYGAVDWRDLVAAMERASARSLSRWAGTWLLRPAANKVSAPHAGMHAHDYALIAPTRAGAVRAMRLLARTHDALERKHLWEYLWAAVRNRALHPAQLVEIALSQAANERSDLTLSRLAERLRIVIDRLLDPDEQLRIVPLLESLAWREIRSSKSEGMRRAWTRALIRWSRTPAGFTKLQRLVSRRQQSLADRLATAAALVAGGWVSARKAASELSLDPGSIERRLAVHCLQAASPSAASKHQVFARWIEDDSLPEYWIDAALPYLNHPAQAQLTLPLLKPALEALPMLERTRKIFFVDRWLAAFIDGQRGVAAHGIIRNFLDRSTLAPDLRRKVIQASNALERDIAVYRHWHR